MRSFAKSAAAPPRPKPPLSVTPLPPPSFGNQATLQRKTPNLRDMVFDQPQPALPATRDQAEALVQQKLWCRDTGFTGLLHGGGQKCYRELPQSDDCPATQQVCFNQQGERELSPDLFSSTTRTPKANGDCQLGKCAAYHLNDVMDARDDSCTLSKPIGALMGASLGEGLLQRAAATYLGMQAVCWAHKRLAKKLIPGGWVPTVSLSGAGGTFGLGFDKISRYEVEEQSGVHVGLRPSFTFRLRGMRLGDFSATGVQGEAGIKGVAREGSFGLTGSAGVGAGLDKSGNADAFLQWSVGLTLGRHSEYEVKVRQQRDADRGTLTTIELTLTAGGIASRLHGH